MDTGHLGAHTCTPDKGTPSVYYLKCCRCGLKVESTATRCPRCFQLLIYGQCRGSCQRCAQHSNDCREGK